MSTDDEQTQILMNHNQFQLAIKGSRLSEKNIKIAYSVLVENVSRGDITDTEKLSKQTLSIIIMSVEANLKKQLDANGLSMVEHFIVNDAVSAEDRKEKALIGRILKA